MKDTTGCPCKHFECSAPDTLIFCRSPVWAQAGIISPAGKGPNEHSVPVRDCLVRRGTEEYQHPSTKSTVSLQKSCAACRGCSKSLGHKKTVAVILLRCFQRELPRFFGTPEKVPGKILNVAPDPARREKQVSSLQCREMTDTP